MEADFTRFYSADLRQVCWGDSPWGVRRLLTHVKYLPRDSAYARSLSGTAAYWDERAELLATLVDATQAQTAVLLAVNGNKPDEPKPYPRPGPAVEPEQVSLTGLHDFLGSD